MVFKLFSLIILWNYFMLILVMCDMNLYPVYPHRFENIHTTEKFYSFFDFTLIFKT